MRRGERGKDENEQIERGGEEDRIRRENKMRGVMRRGGENWRTCKEEERRDEEIERWTVG